ncbi:hypothetical protein TSUD_271720 [Trifolium subterraneum]|uniref:Uncharacterized protein n=1 Tax=Trifolium subterraneum TaxID=3900 RepID=A0A2Z6NI02_TRISU|nr:hypothetical protein TSUD_271720 [Trifolium subterraneum]
MEKSFPPREINKYKAIPIKDKNGVDIYDNRNYSAPVHAVIGMAGFSLDKVLNNSRNYAANFDIATKYADMAKIPLRFCIALAG